MFYKIGALTNLTKKIHNKTPVPVPVLFIVNFLIISFFPEHLGTTDSEIC